VTVNGFARIIEGDCPVMQTLQVGYREVSVRSGECNRMKKITIELTDYEIDWLARVGEVWKINDANASSDEENNNNAYDVETVAATLAANEAKHLCQEYNNSRFRHITGRSYQ
jgi:hypothetical protein